MSRLEAMAPDAQGHFGPYGGRFVPETLMEPLRELEAAYAAATRDEAFRDALAGALRDYVGRPTPLTHAARLSERLGCRVLLKREDLCHTGAHKINNALGQGRHERLGHEPAAVGPEITLRVREGLGSEHSVPPRRAAAAAPDP